MFGQLTRAQMRDQVRRDLGQIPPIDDGTGVVGALPSRWPHITNANLNTAIDKAVALVSRKCRIAGDAVPRTVAVVAQTADGPYSITLQSVTPTASIGDVKKVTWQETSGEAGIPLTPASWEELDRDRIGWETTEVGTPQRYWVEAGKLLIWPSPSVAGSLLILYGQTLWSTATSIDGEVCEILNAEHFPLLIALTGAYICKQFPDDVEMMDRFSGFIGEAGVTKDFQVLPDGMFADVMSFFARRNRSHQGSMHADVGRVPMGYGNR